MEEKKQRIIFHVGLEKTATTFLQRSVFPKFRDVVFIPKREYRNAESIIKAKPEKTVLISHEFGRRDFEAEMRKFAKLYPQARPVIVFREHAGWLASYYRFLVKRGMNATFREFFDLDENKGLWKKEELVYFKDIKLLEQLYDQKPLVLFHDDLKKDPQGFIERLKDYCGVKHADEISFRVRHKAYSDKELRIRLWVTRHTFLKEFYDVGHIKRYWGKRLYNRIVRYSVLYVAKLIPAMILRRHELVPSESLKKIREYYNSDLQRCKAYAKTNNPL